MPKDISAPSFQFYPDDFASDGKVEAMTTEEVGAYILLICKAWREKPAASIPTDDRILARWARLSDDRWLECKPRVLGPWKLLKGARRYVQPRLKREFDKQLARRRQSQESATIAAKARWEGKRDHASRMPDGCVGNASSSSSSSSTSSLPLKPPAGGRERKREREGNNARIIQEEVTRGS